MESDPIGPAESSSKEDLATKRPLLLVILPLLALAAVGCAGVFHFRGEPPRMVGRAIAEVMERYGEPTKITRGVPVGGFEDFRGPLVPTGFGADDTVLNFLVSRPLHQVDRYASFWVLQGVVVAAAYTEVVHGVYAIPR